MTNKTYRMAMEEGERNINQVPIAQVARLYYYTFAYKSKKFVAIHLNQKSRDA